MTPVLADVVPFAEVKRFLERFTADPAFAQRVKEDPSAPLTELSLSWAPSVVEELWNVEVGQAVQEGRRESTPSAQAYRARIKQRIAYRERVRREGTPQDPRFRAWRERQVQRLFHEDGPAKGDSVVHAPFCIELARGCSVGCWFCGVGAEKLTELYRHTPENRAMFRGVLEVLRDLIGPGGVGHGFCYWASDPMDNPDYEKFLLDYKDVTGRWPQTTTALAMKDPERTRALIRLAQSQGGEIDRFSVLTLKLLERIHATFTPQELECVECVSQNREVDERKAVAGKAYLKALKEGKTPEVTGSIACVSGFLINLVDRTVKLVSPVDADERWPLGYVVHDQGTFESPEEFAAQVQRMVAHSMPQRLEDLPRVRPTRRGRLETTEKGFVLRTRATMTTVEDETRAAELRSLATLLAEGRTTAEDIALLQVYQASASWEGTMALLRSLFAKGLLDEEPEVA